MAKNLKLTLGTEAWVNLDKPFAYGSLPPGFLSA